MSVVVDLRPGVVFKVEKINDTNEWTLYFGPTTAPRAFCVVGFADRETALEFCRTVTVELLREAKLREAKK